MTSPRGSLQAIEKDNKLPTSAVRTIWMVLAAWTEDDTGKFFIASQSELADLCGFKRETTNRALKYLTSSGLISRLGRTTDNKKTLYQMNFDCDPQVTPKVIPRSQAAKEQSDSQVTAAVTQGSQGCDSQVTCIEEGTVIGTVIGTVNSSPEVRKPRQKKEWEYPDWWEPLTALPGYVKRTYTKTVENIRLACGEAGVDPAEVVKDTGYRPVKPQSGADLRSAGPPITDYLLRITKYNHSRYSPAFRLGRRCWGRRRPF